MMHFDSTRADHIRVSKCKDAEIVLLNGRTSTLQKLDMLMADMTSSRTTVAKRDEAAHILKHSPFKNQRSAARQYLAFGKLNESTMRRDASPDWGAIVRLGCIVAVMAVAGYFISEAVLAHARAAADAAMAVVQ